MDKSDILRFIAKAKLRKVTDIDLSNKDIINIPEEIGDLTWIKSLNLSYNNITELPSNICNLVNLDKLLLTRNQITKLPAGIANLQNLTIFDLSYNPIVKIPSEIGLLSNLVTFDASFCELISLPFDITNLYSLKNLNLEDNPLKFPQQKVIKRGLYAIMHFLTMEKRKKEASKVVMQIFNMPEPLQSPFKQYIKYFNHIVSEANHKDVVIDMNFINQYLQQEMDINTNVEGYLYEVMQHIETKITTIKNSRELDSEMKDAYIDSRVNSLKDKLQNFNVSLDDKINEIQKIKQEIKGIHDSLDN